MKRMTGCWLAVVVGLSLVVSGCYQTSPPAPAPPAPLPQETPAPSGGTVYQVSIKNFAFSPREIAIKAGDTVTWTEEDTVHHKVAGSSWGSEDLGQGQTYSQTFEKAGSYDYVCRYHATMKGKVVVE